MRRPAGEDADALFVDCIDRGVASKIVTPESAAESVMVTQAEIKSAVSGRPVRCG